VDVGFFLHRRQLVLERPGQKRGWVPGFIQLEGFLKMGGTLRSVFRAKTFHPHRAAPLALYDVQHGSNAYAVDTFYVSAECWKVDLHPASRVTYFTCVPIGCQVLQANS